MSFEQSIPVAIWAGCGLSLAWLGAVGGALVTLDAGLAPRLAIARGFAAAVVLAAVALLALPSLTAMARGTALLTNGPASTLPAYVAAEGRDDPDVGTNVLTPQNVTGISARVVWGGGETLGGQTTLLSTRSETSADDSVIAELAADLATSSAENVVAQLAGHGVGFVLLAPALPPESDAARATRLSVTTSLDQRDTLDAVGTFTGSFLEVAALSWLISFVIASVLFRVVELPFLRLKDQPLANLFRRPGRHLS